MLQISFMSGVCSGGARGHPDKGAAFPDGVAETVRPKAGMEFLGRGRQPPYPDKGDILQYLWGEAGVIFDSQESEEDFSLAEFFNRQFVVHLFPRNAVLVCIEKYIVITGCNGNIVGQQHSPSVSGRVPSTPSLHDHCGWA